MEYIDKNLKIKPSRGNRMYPILTDLCNKKLVFFKKGHVGAVFLYKINISGKQKQVLVKKTIVSKKSCNEANITIKINELMNKKKLPDLFGKVYLVYKCKFSDFSEYYWGSKKDYKKKPDNYIFIIDKYEEPIWKELDSTNIKRVKSVVIMLLIAVWHMNHNGNIYHDDIVAGKSHKLVINNVLLEKSKKKSMRCHMLDPNKKINIKLYGYKIRIIDFGQACFKDIYIDNFDSKNIKSASINKFYKKNDYFKKFKFKSEIVYIIKCLLSYWKVNSLLKIDSILYKYYTDISKKHKDLHKFDEEVVYDFNKNFVKIIRIFSNEWPNPPYFTKLQSVRT